MFGLSKIALVIALLSFIGVVVIYLALKKLSADILREIGHVDAFMLDEKVTGTDYVYCDGDCSQVSRPNNNLKCRRNDCTGSECSC